MMRTRGVYEADLIAEIPLTGRFSKVVPEVGLKSPPFFLQVERCAISIRWRFGSERLAATNFWQTRQ